MEDQSAYVIDAIDEANAIVHVTFTLSDGTVLTDRQEKIAMGSLDDPAAVHAYLSQYLIDFENGIRIEQAAVAKKAHPALLAFVGTKRTPLKLTDTDGGVTTTAPADDSSSSDPPQPISDPPAADAPPEKAPRARRSKANP